MNYLKVTNQISNLHGKRLKVHSFNCVPKSTLFHYYFFTLFLLYLYSLNSLTSYTPTLLTILTFLLLHFLYKQIIGETGAISDTFCFSAAKCFKI
jgi:hypothetical protein